VHDFIIPKLGRTVPYGVYDIAGDVGWGSVGVDHDTAAFAVNVIHKRRHQEVRVESIGLSRAASIRGGIVENE
jgi:Rhodopirellula transposase DDE domain